MVNVLNVINDGDVLFAGNFVFARCYVRHHGSGFRRLMRFAQFVLVLFGVKNWDLARTRWAWRWWCIWWHQRRRYPCSTQGFIKLIQIPNHIGGRVSRPFKSPQQTLALVHQVLKFATGVFGSLGQIRQHSLTIRAHFGDHLAALLFGHLKLLFGFARNIRSAT